MRDDLLDAQAALKWAEAQIPVLQDRFLAWQRSRPYKLVVEPDTNAGCQFLTAHRVQLDPIISAEIGAIINATRSALDLLAATLATRNGVKPNADTHFPIFRCIYDMIDPIGGVETKKWLSAAEIATIKSLEPYNGGDEVLFVLHQLDIKRKHERLITVYPDIGRSWVTWVGAGIEPVLRYVDDKAILYRVPYPPLFTPTEGNSYVASEIFFNEPTIGIAREPAIPLLRKFAARIREIINLFDVP